MAELLIELDDDTWNEVKEVAEAMGISPAAFIETALEDYVITCEELLHEANDKIVDPVTDG